jgi:hypothetical protein
MHKFLQNSSRSHDPQSSQNGAKMLFIQYFQIAASQDINNVKSFANFVHVKLFML